MRGLSKDAGGVRALLSPKTIAIVGASDRAGNWSKKVFDVLRRTGFPGAIFPVNPRNANVWGGRTCYPDLASLPEPPDHVVVLVPGAAAIDAIHEAGKAGARSATIFSSGFGEGGDPEGRALAARLQKAIARSGLAVSGPNCLGNLAAPYKLMTLTDDRIAELQRGPIAIFGQSGGIVTAIYRSLASRGMQPGYALTVGNEIGLNAADYIRFFAEDADTKVIACFIEAIREPAAFRDACKAARAAGKPVVAIKLGGSDASRAAALAHTGSLAGSLACFDAVAEAMGIIRVDTIDAMTEVVELLTHGERPAGSRIGAITFSGGLKGLLLEAAARSGIVFPELAPETMERLRAIVGVGTSLGNPLDAGFTALSSADAYLQCIDIVRGDPNLDLLLIQEELPLREDLNRKAQNLRLVDGQVARSAGTPVAVVSMSSYMYSDFTRAFRKEFPRLAVLHEVDKALKAVQAVSRWSASADSASEEVATPGPRAEPAAREALLRGTPPDAHGHIVLGEGAAKRLLALYGLSTPRERFAAGAEEAARAADATGYPVVLKLVSPDVQHKTEVGGVRVGLSDASAVRLAFDGIRDALKRAAPHARFEGVLVAEQVKPGVELVIGVHRDPEVGPVAMFGGGGVLVELTDDVAFAPVPLTPRGARALMARTKASQLIAGYRGALPCDGRAVVEALLAVSRIAADFGDRLESVDLNPVVAHPGESGAVVLDALIVLRSDRGGVVAN